MTGQKRECPECLAQGVHKIFRGPRAGQALGGHRYQAHGWVSDGAQSVKARLKKKQDKKHGPPAKKAAPPPAPPARPEVIPSAVEVVRVPLSLTPAGLSPAKAHVQAGIQETNLRLEEVRRQLAGLEALQQEEAQLKSHLEVLEVTARTLDKDPDALLVALRSGAAAGGEA